MAHVCNRRLACAWVAWVDATGMAIEKKRRIAWANVTHTRSWIRAAIHRWMDYVSYQMRRAALIGRAIGRLRNIAMHKALQQWLLAIFQKRSRKAIVRKMLHYRATLGLRTWHAAVIDRQRIRMLLQRAIANIFHRQLAGSFRHWH
eukprot:SAG31_NODE_26687_length_438_cov_0.752212_1_plen_145_part_11